MQNDMSELFEASETTTDPNLGAQEAERPSTTGKLDLRSMTRGQLQELMSELGQPAFRVKQIEEWVWRKNVSSLDEMSNLPKTLRHTLQDRVTLDSAEEIIRQLSTDGSRKYLLRFSDGVSVECVGMPSKGKLTACASSQAGCGIGCAFCATGMSGLTRSLSAGEIYEQVMHVRDDFGRRVTSVVLMGQGEPFANYTETLAALRRLNSPDGAGIGARHLTVSTRSEEHTSELQSR